MNDTREQWLLRGADAMIPMLKEHDLVIPNKLMISSGFAKYAKGNAIGQCWAPENTSDGTTHIFICPRLQDPLNVLDVLLHEMVHAAVGCECGHRGPFVKAVRAVGLAGKPTATYAEPGSALHTKLGELSEQLGAYPHSAITLKPRSRPPGGGWLKMVSDHDEKFVVRISPKVLREHGVPMDPWGNRMKRADGEEISNDEQGEE